MNTTARTGIFLCKCGENIEPLIDLNSLEGALKADAAHCEILAWSCLKPGMDRIMSAVSEHDLNRVIIAGCDGRIMCKKFEEALEPSGILKGQISMVNLRGHVAAVSDAPMEQKTKKSEKLIRAAMAEMETLNPTPKKAMKLKGTVAIAGNGIGAFPAAWNLVQAGVECVLCTDTTDPNEIIKKLPLVYPGERNQYDRVRAIIEKVLESDKVTVKETSGVDALLGITGAYTLMTLDPSGEKQPVKADLVIAALDAELFAPEPEFGYDGNRVLIQPEMEVQMDEYGIPKKDVVFWVSDHEYGDGDFAQLSAKAAWNMARHIRKASRSSRVVILHNQMMPVPLSAAERGINRELGIEWIAYDKTVRPIVQDGYITYCNLEDHIEHEINWEFLVLSPKRGLRGETLAAARALGMIQGPTRFLTVHQAKVRPEMVGRQMNCIVGSAKFPCDLQETINQGREAGNKNADMIELSKQGQLFIPRHVSWVDPEKCVGCGRCQELCDCNAIGSMDYPGGGLSRIVDPMLCTGGGTCAAACPENAMEIRNNNTAQREAGIAQLSQAMDAEEIVCMACVWGGLPAADHAGHKKLAYDPGVHIIGVPCVGQIDPSVMARAFVEGASGLILTGCLPDSCHHSFGVDHTWTRVAMIKKLFTLCGFDRRRIALAHADLNKPEEFVKTVNAFSDQIRALGTIEKTKANQDKLAAIYDLCKNNTRIRTLLAVSLRRAKETTFRGDQLYAPAFDRDFTQALEEEYDFPESALFEAVE